MSDRILVDRIPVFAHHGILPEERRDGQTFYVSLEAELDLAEAGRTDDLARTVSYADLAALVHAVATRSRFDLIEAWAETIAREALAAFPRLDGIAVRIDKPSAPMPVAVGGVAIAIIRRRDREAG